MIGLAERPEEPTFECQDCKAKKRKRVCGAENCTK